MACCSSTRAAPTHLPPPLSTSLPILINLAAQHDLDLINIWQELLDPIVAAELIDGVPIRRVYLQHALNQLPWLVRDHPPTRGIQIER